MFKELLSGRTEASHPEAQKGRFGDDHMVHAETGEVISPKRGMENNPSFSELLAGLFEKENLDLSEFGVGMGTAKVNPETEKEEYFDPMTMMLIGSGVGLGKSFLDSRGMDKANRYAQQGFSQAQSELQPYSAMGLKGMQDYSERISGGFDPEKFRNSEAYNFAKEQGLDAIESRLAASGMAQSGKAAKEAGRFVTGLAEQDYGAAFNRWLQDNQQHANMGNMGLQSALGIGDLYSQKGQTAADAQIAKQSSQNDILGGLFNLGASLFS